MIVQGDCLDVLRTREADSVDSLVTDPPAGISFMGKEWDHHKGGRKEWIAWLESVMRECMRVLKPGAHGLVWALPRTAHWTATALEDAGFEIRDCITHLFGSGFPKSHNLEKATEGVVSGQGTALKPASEFWWLVRKPCSEKTVAANVLKWGTGGLNIDGCRIAGWSQADKNNMAVSSRGRPGIFGLPGSEKALEPNTQGRFPANLVFSHSPRCTEDACDMFECAVKMLDEQSGITKPCNRGPSTAGHQNQYVGGKIVKPVMRKDHSSVGGGASRFFYCAKVSPSERGESTHPTMKAQKLMRYLCRLVTPPGGTILDPFLGSGSTGLAAKQEGFEFIGIEREPEYFEIAKARIG